MRIIFLSPKWSIIFFVSFTEFLKSLKGYFVASYFLLELAEWIMTSNLSFNFSNLVFLDILIILCFFFKTLTIFLPTNPFAPIIAIFIMLKL